MRIGLLKAPQVPAHFLNWRGRLPIELLFRFLWTALKQWCFRNVTKLNNETYPHPGNVTGATRTIWRQNRGARSLTKSGDHFEDAGAGPSAEIERLETGLCFERFEGGQMTLGQVDDVDIVAYALLKY